MDRYAVVGHPVEHSQSPYIHERFAEQTGQAMSYERLPAPPDGFARTVREFAAGGARGCNVTVPFKGEAWALAAHRTERAALAGTANTLRFDADGWHADNTDGVGLVRDITRQAGVAIGGARVLLVGAGGAAAGALGPLLAERPAALIVVNRTPARAEELVRRHAAAASVHGVDLQAAALADCGTGFDIVVNATSASLNEAALPLAPAVFRRGGLALDMMYGPAARPFLAWAESHGAVPRDGLGMLVEQAAEAFWFWRGVRPDVPPVLRALRERLAQTVA
jgi:shikimate dehydrogenase